MGPGEIGDSSSSEAPHQWAVGGVAVAGMSRESHPSVVLWTYREDIHRRDDVQHLVIMREVLLRQSILCGLYERQTTKIRFPPRGNVASSASRVRFVLVESCGAESVNLAMSSLIQPACPVSRQSEASVFDTPPVSCQNAAHGEFRTEPDAETLTLPWPTV